MKKKKKSSSDGCNLMQKILFYSRDINVSHSFIHQILGITLPNLKKKKEKGKKRNTAAALFHIG